MILRLGEVIGNGRGFRKENTIGRHFTDVLNCHKTNSIKSIKKGIGGGPIVCSFLNKKKPGDFSLCSLRTYLSNRLRMIN